MRVRGRRQQGTRCSICTANQVQVPGLQSFLQAEALKLVLWLVEKVGLRYALDLVGFVASPLVPAP